MKIQNNGSGRCRRVVSRGEHAATGRSHLQDGEKVAVHVLAVCARRLAIPIHLHADPTPVSGDSLEGLRVRAEVVVIRERKRAV